jgi:hypothetical protein
MLRTLCSDEKLKRVVIRHYGTDAIRIGPMSVSDRVAIDRSLHISTEKSGKSSHHDLDHAYELAHASGLSVEKADFELTQRHTPFSPEFANYFTRTVRWMAERLPCEDRARLYAVCQEPDAKTRSLYFAQLEFVAILSID